MAKTKGWIKGAIKHPGAFKAKAKKAGVSTSTLAHRDKGKGRSPDVVAQHIADMLNPPAAKQATTAGAGVAKA